METLTGNTNFRLTENYIDWDRGWRYATNLVLNMHGLICHSTNLKYKDIEFIESTETLNSTLSIRNKKIIFNYHNPAIKWLKRLKICYLGCTKLTLTCLYHLYVSTTLSEPQISAQLLNESLFCLNCMISLLHIFSPLLRIFFLVEFNEACIVMFVWAIEILLECLVVWNLV